jgi:hypothetical protein
MAPVCFGCRFVGPNEIGARCRQFATLLAVMAITHLLLRRADPGLLASGSGVKAAGAAVS